MSGLGFVRLPKRSLRILRAFLDGFYRERSPNLFNHPHVINECRGRRLSKETQLFNELVLWLRYYEALVARRPAHIDLMNRIRTEYDSLFGFVRADGDLSPYFGLTDVDIVGGLAYADDYIPRVDVFIQGLYDLAAYISAKDAAKVVDAFGFINLRYDETQRLVANARGAAENMHDYRLLDVRDFQNHDPLVLALNRLMYLCRVAYAMSKGWKEIRESAIDRLNLLRRRLILSLHENPAFSRVYARNALEQAVDHSNAYGLMRRLEEDRVLFKNALRWGDPEWELDSTTEEEDDDERGDENEYEDEDTAVSYEYDDGDDGVSNTGGRLGQQDFGDGIGALPPRDPHLARGKSGSDGRDRASGARRDAEREAASIEKKRSGASASAPRREGRRDSARSRKDSFSSWRSVADDVLLDLPKPLKAEPDAAHEKRARRPSGPKRRSSIASIPVGAADETPFGDPPKDATADERRRTYWLENGKPRGQDGNKTESDRVFVSDGKTVALPPAPSVATPANAPATPSVPVTPTNAPATPSAPSASALRFPSNPFGSGIKADDFVLPPISYLDEKYFQPTGPPAAGRDGAERARSSVGKAAKPRKSTANQRSGVGTYDRRRAARSEDEDGYYWDDLDAADGTAGTTSGRGERRVGEILAPEEELERIHRQLQGLNINSPTVAPGPPHFAPPLPREFIRGPATFAPADDDKNDVSDSSGVTVLTNDTGGNNHRTGTTGGGNR